VDKEVAQYLFSMLKDGREFVVSQTVDVLHQLIVWQTCVSTAGIVLGISLLFAGVKATRKSMQFADRHHCEGRMVMVGALAFFLTCAGILFTSFNTFDLIKVLTAPKIFLLEYLRGIITRAN